MYQIPDELRENNENRLTVRQLDLMMDSLSSYILEVENYTDGDTIKDEVEAPIKEVSVCTEEEKVKLFQT